MIRKLTKGILCAALLLSAAGAFAESAAARPAGSRDLRQRSKSEGVDKLTLLRLTGGISMPSGNLGDGFETGPGLGLSLAYGVSPIVLLSTGVGYHHFGADGGGADIDIIPVTFNVDAMIPTEGHVRPWVGGGLGLYNVDLEVDTSDPFAGDDGVSESNAGINFGMGLGGPMGARTTWGAAFRYHHIFEGDTFNDLDFLTFQFGVGFAL